MVLVLFANTKFKMYLLRVLSLIQKLRYNVSVSASMSGSGAVGLGVGVGSYQPGVYVPLKALFLVLCMLLLIICHSDSSKNQKSTKHNGILKSPKHHLFSIIMIK